MIKEKNLKKHSFPKSSRLLKNRDFVKTTEAGKKFITKNLAVTANPNESGKARLGITISKKISKLATKRNYFKRCVREAYRHLSSDLPPYDITVNARHGAHLLTAEEIKRELVRCLEKLKLLAAN